MVKVTALFRLWLGLRCDWYLDCTLGFVRKFCDSQWGSAGDCGFGFGALFCAPVGVCGRGGA